MNEYKKSYLLRVNEEVFDKFKVVAASNFRSVNAQIEALIVACVSEHEAKHGEIVVKTTD